MSFTNQQVFRSNEISQQLIPLPNLAVFLQKWFGGICGPIEEPVSLLIWGMCLARHKMKAGIRFIYWNFPMSRLHSQHVLHTHSAILSMLYIHHSLPFSTCYRHSLYYYNVWFRGCRYCSHWGLANCYSFVLGHGASQNLRRTVCFQN